VSRIPQRRSSRSKQSDGTSSPWVDRTGASTEYPSSAEERTRRSCARAQATNPEISHRRISLITPTSRQVLS
jgi:hypothetical protein